MGRILSRGVGSMFALALAGCSSSGGGGFIVDGGTDGSSGSGGSAGSFGGFAGSASGGTSSGGSAGSASGGTSFGGSAGSSSGGSSTGGSAGISGGTGGFGATGGTGGGNTGGASGDGGPFQCVTITSSTTCTAPNQATCTCAGCKNIACTDGTDYSDCVCPECATDSYCSDATNCNQDNICDPFNEGCGCSDCVNHPLC